MEPEKRHDRPRSSPGQPEILAPGGDSDSVRAAILAGADAVYLGLDRFNARMRADNLHLAELADLARVARSRGVRLYVTLNVLLSQPEMEEALSLAVAAWNAGADAVILQDWGLLHLMRRLYPQVEAHASTQLTTHNSRQIELLARFGVSQLNLSRELSLEEIRPLTECCHRHRIQSEVFVHGAYCISFSGQCYMSSFLCGLSGNRGRCVQPCRREYRIPGGAESGGRAGPSGGFPWLNLKDNNALSAAGDLIAAGVDALKIEGRRKGYFYVYTIVRAWRLQLLSLLPPDAPEKAGGRTESDEDPFELVRKVYNRGFDIGYLTGRISPAMFSESVEDSSLQPLGAVLSYGADRRVLRVGRPIPAEQFVPGDAAGIFADRDQEHFIAQVVVEERLAPDSFRVRIEHELQGRILRGQHLFRIPKYRESEALAARLAAMKPERIPLLIKVEGNAGAPLLAEFAVLSGPHRTVRVQSGVPLTAARKNPLTVPLLFEHFSKLGDSVYALDPPERDETDASIRAENLADGLFLPVSELNRMRREAVAGLDAMSGRSRPVLLPPGKLGFPDCLPPASSGGRDDPQEPAEGSPCRLPGRMALPGSVFQQKILPLISDPEDLDWIRSTGIGFFCFEVRPGIDPPEEPGLIPWFPAILLEEDLAGCEALLASGRWPWIVSDNSGLGLASALLRIPWVAGTLLNITNAWSAAALVQAAGAAGAVFSMELGLGQIQAAVRSPGPFAAAGRSGSPFLKAAPAFGPILAMTTRQCLVHRFRKCGKSVCDRDCFVSCRASGTLDGGSGARFHAVKQPGCHSRLWDDRPLFVPGLQALLGKGLDLLLVDLRDPGFFGWEPLFKARILTSFLEGRAEELASDFRKRGRGTAAGGDLS